MVNEDKKRMYFGMVLMSAVGLLLVSVYIVSTNIWYALLPVPGWPVVLAVTVGAVAGNWLARKKFVPSPPLWVTVVALLAGVPICCYVPFGVRTIQLEWMASEVPRCPDAKLVSTDINPLSSDVPGGFTLYYQSDSDSNAVAKFYREKLSEQGFAESKEWHAQAGQYFCKDGFCLTIMIGKKDSPRPLSSDVSSSAVGAKTWVNVTYEKW